jgi:hypothetical protein
VEPPRRTLHMRDGKPDRSNENIDDILRPNKDEDLSLVEENARLRSLVVELSAFVIKCIGKRK